MNDMNNSRGNTSTGIALMGFALGAALGAGVALLLAPESGKRTRERLASTARGLGQRAGDTLGQARDTVTELGTDAKSAIKAGQEAFMSDLAGRESRAERRLTGAHDGAKRNP